MKRRVGKNRKLGAESLESRQLLHGGAMAGGGDPPSTGDRVEAAFQRFDQNEDSMLTENELSERQWNRISAADADQNSAVSSEELTAYIEARAAERAESGEREDERRRGRRSDRDNRERRRGPTERLTPEQRLDRFFTTNDENEDGLLTQNEVSERVWADLAAADLNADGVSREELQVQQEARRQARADAAFARLDANDDGGVTVDEVPERLWNRISAADANNDDSVTQQELHDYAEAQRAERQAERDAADQQAMSEGNAGPQGAEPDTTGRRGRGPVGLVDRQ